VVSPRHKHTTSAQLGKRRRLRESGLKGALGHDFIYNIASLIQDYSSVAWCIEAQLFDTLRAVY
jgi:hypothetical protein